MIKCQSKVNEEISVMINEGEKPITFYFYFWANKCQVGCQFFTLIPLPLILVFAWALLEELGKQLF